MKNTISIILPAKNESESLEELLPQLNNLYNDAEIIVVNDGSTDNTIDICNNNAVKVISHLYSKGNGASIKTGARQASGDILVFMDADGQHLVSDISKLLEGIEKGNDMVIGCRDIKKHASYLRMIGNSFYNLLASWITGHRIKDLTSGFRAVKAEYFKEFIHLLPNGFSYPTTITMAMYRAGYSIEFVAINVQKRIGNSHLSLFNDGIRFLLIIFKIGTLYSPLKFFFPISLTFFLTGVFYYIYTFVTLNRFTNMSALMITTSILIFFIGIVSEQLTMLFYRDGKSKDSR